LICEIATLELPVLAIVTFCVAEEVPVVTFPKLKFVGLMPRVKVPAMPVPLRLTDVGEVAALLEMDILPEAGPAEVGRKVTVIMVCSPAPTFNGSEYPLTLNAAPDSIIWVMVRVAVPLFVMIKAWDRLLPITAFPKFMELELNCIAGAGVALTVSVAAALVTVPAALLTTTRNVDPLSTVVVTGVV